MSRQEPERQAGGEETESQRQSESTVFQEYREPKNPRCEETLPFVSILSLLELVPSAEARAKLSVLASGRG